MSVDGRAELIDKIEKYIAPVLTALCSFLFFLIVPFLPGTPILPALVSLALGYYATKRPKGAAILFYFFVFISILWQLVGFGLLVLVTQPIGLLVAFLIFAPLLMNFLNPRLSPSSLALTFLAVGVMLTPEYYLSIPLIASAVVLDGLASVAADASTFILTLAPFLLIENALYYAEPSVTASSPPIIFSQLSRLAANIRPPLPGLNIFLTGIPANLISSSSSAVISFLTTSSYVMIVPLGVFAVIFTASVSIAGILTTLRDKLFVFARLMRMLKVVWPMVVTTVSCLVFAGLLIALSPPSLVDYRTALGQDPSHFGLLAMLGSAVFFGAFLSFNGYLNATIRSAASVMASVAESLGKAEKLIAELRSLVVRVNKGSPSVGLRVEAAVLEEYSSYLSDVERNRTTSNVQALSTWDGDLRGRIIPTLESLPEQIRVKVVNELNSVVSISASLNSTMEHVGAGTVFPGEGYAVAGLSTDQALETYTAFTTELKVKVSELYNLYITAAKALDSLLDKTVSEPPINPEVLISTQDYVTAMRLLAEDYSMTFHLEYKDELAAKTSELTEKLTLLAQSLGGEDEARLSRILDIGAVQPLDSPRLLKAVEAAMAAMEDIVNESLTDAERLSTMVSTLMPAATTVLKFETLTQLDRLKQLKREASVLKPVLVQVAHFAVKMKAVLEAHRQSQRNDEENLIMIAQYPLAQQLIHDLSTAKSMVSLSELPFQPDAAHLYAKIYVASNPAARYDDQSEALLTSHA